MGEKKKPKKQKLGTFTNGSGEHNWKRAKKNQWLNTIQEILQLTDEPRRGSWKQNGIWEGEMSQCSCWQLLKGMGSPWICSRHREGSRALDLLLLLWGSGMAPESPNPAGISAGDGMGWNPPARSWTAGPQSLLLIAGC